MIDINEFQKKHLYWSGALDIFLGTVPEGVYLRDFSTKNYQILLIGKAKEREILIDFQDRITKSGCFENINVPLSNLVEKSDIDFQMDFVVKKECLMEKNK
ncbi:MAG: hypothetical protein UW95_C0016G0016 [Parcubacteria group bacterium GW2011_GWC1_45_14]|nr:MAG: hypothetical protein UW95_C0016G0016 [Parcubacteria group bacterium GW2011_GWC1_45_14]